MRRIILTGVCVWMAFSSWAQQTKNVFLNADFWKAKPSIDMVKAEIAKGASVSERSSKNMDAGVIAILNGAPEETIKYLIDQNIANIDKPTHEGRSYLNWASLRGNEPIIRYLVEKGANVNFKDAHETTPIQALANSGNANLELYDFLIDHGADVNAKNKGGASLILIAAQKDKDHVLTNYFLSKGLSLKDEDKSGSNIFDYAARGGNIDMMKYLLTQGIEARPTALLAVAQGTRGGANGLPVYEYLAALPGMDFHQKDKSGNTLLHLVAKKQKQADVIKYLMNKGLDVNAVDNEGNTAFLNAAAAGDKEMIDLLLPKVKNINLANQQGLTALSLAVKGNSAEVVDILLKKGANAKVEDAQGNNLNYYLVESFKNARTKDDFDKKVALLQAKGYNTTAVSKNQNTILHYAVATEEKALVEKVLAHKVDVNHKNDEGITALHKAAMISKDDAILHLLINKGADKKIKSKFDETAFDIASENDYLSKHKVSVDFLK